jgi:hypothetical protein
MPFSVVYRAKTIEFLNLKQTGGVEDYRKQFKQLVYDIWLFDTSLSNTMLTTQFIPGLREKLRGAVEMKLPDSVAKATILASILEKTVGEEPEALYKNRIVQATI